MIDCSMFGDCNTDCWQYYENDGNQRSRSDGWLMEMDDKITEIMKENKKCSTVILQ